MFHGVHLSTFPPKMNSTSFLVEKTPVSVSMLDTLLDSMKVRYMAYMVGKIMLVIFVIVSDSDIELISNILCDHSEEAGSIYKILEVENGKW